MDRFFPLSWKKYLFSVQNANPAHKVNCDDPTLLRHNHKTWLTAVPDYLQTHWDFGQFPRIKQFKQESMHKYTNKQMDRCYQTYYLPAPQAIIISNTCNRLIRKIMMNHIRWFSRIFLIISWSNPLLKSHLHVPWIYLCTFSWIEIASVFCIKLFSIKTILFKALSISVYFAKWCCQISIL